MKKLLFGLICLLAVTALAESRFKRDLRRQYVEPFRARGETAQTESQAQPTNEPYLDLSDLGGLERSFRANAIECQVVRRLPDQRAEPQAPAAGDRQQLIEAFRAQVQGLVWYIAVKSRNYQSDARCPITRAPESCIHEHHRRNLRDMEDVLSELRQLDPAARPAPPPPPPQTQAANRPLLRQRPVVDSANADESRRLLGSVRILNSNLTPQVPVEPPLTPEFPVTLSVRTETREGVARTILVLDSAAGGAQSATEIDLTEMRDEARAAHRSAFERTGYQPLSLRTFPGKTARLSNGEEADVFCYGSYVSGI